MTRPAYMARGRTVADGEGKGTGKGPPPIVRWQNALFFSGKQGPKPLVRATLMTMAIRAENSDLTFFMKMDEVALRMGVSKRTAERHVADALESGWLVQTVQGNSTGKASEYRLTFGATDNPEGVILDPPGGERGNTVKCDGIGETGVSAGHGKADSSDGIGVSGVSAGHGNTVKSDGPIPTNLTDQLLTTTTNKNPRSPEPTVTPEDDDGDGRTFLPQWWEPNPTHRRSAERAGIDVDAAAVKFRCRMVVERRTDWDSTFGAFINEAHAGREDDVFPMRDPAEDHEPSSPAPAEDDESLPITWQRPPWLSESDERATRVVAGKPNDDQLSRAVMEYAATCARLGREPVGSEFRLVARRYVLEAVGA